ncbi:hypothetical protein CANTEDRAFT_112070 [Yamadazyma tenuis ATCC 10573]|uniref:Uncharacterized protein n=1 Tax=Candida tenuis (strain ATCC 10573 / BCRC 21748 / CBS 615 / JCM 9827 / NBRC 10315 / NRRL Y-1498 / VKM Y-70) TaxID=590646 RepID=G3AVY7_CANTC|nr:uncharacterized protein CANTEDRAFT_112070 [Yamadazyma tenuis ATCC 10573]EGV66895.1 hypothetical protein CANTEDRAFT_112070 [Yamadazyma tenuis ATCC 10573]
MKGYCCPQKYGKGGEIRSTILFIGRGQYQLSCNYCNVLKDTPPRFPMYYKPLKTFDSNPVSNYEQSFYL